MDTKQPEALRLANMLEKPGYGWHSTPAECAAELQRLQSENDTLRAGYDAARLEIASLQAQLEAVGNGPLICEGTMPAQPAHWSAPTTVLQRAGDALQLLCAGKRPTDVIINGWLDNSSEELQAFCCEHGPNWCQGIAVIDAAMQMVDQPTEIVSPESETDHEHRAAPAQPVPAQPVPAPGVEAVSEREFKQFLSDVLTAAGLVTHGKKCKDLGRRLGEMSMRLLTAPKTAAAPTQALDAARVFWQQHTHADALSMTMAELHDDVELVIRAARGAAQAAPVDAADSDRLDWLTFNLSGAALRAIGVVWSEHGDARRAIDAARATQGGIND